MSSTASNLDSRSPQGHLDTAWEVAVVSSCIVMFVAVISVAIYQVRRRERLRRMKAEQPQKGRRKEQTEMIEDLERGDLNLDERDEDYTDDEDECKEQPDHVKSKRKSKPKAGRSKKRPALRT